MIRPRRAIALVGLLVAIAAFALLARRARDPEASPPRSERANAASTAATPKPPGAAALEPARPDVLLVTIDTLRADHVHAYGYPRETTPHLDRMAREGVVFETAYAPMGTTGPSHVTIFTALEPLAHGVLRNGVAPPASLPWLPDLLAAAGYETAGFVSSFPVIARFGFGRGFAHFDEDFAAEPATEWSNQWKDELGGKAHDRRGAATVDRALEWLQARRDDGRPRFVWVHLFDPHAPYDPPPPYDAAFPATGASERERAIAGYDGEVLYADAQLGRLVAGFTAAARDPLVVVTSDHGEGLWDHGWPGHNRELYEEEVRVPLVVRWPGRLPAGRRVAEPVALVDLVPTIAAAAGLPAVPDAAGIDLVAAISTGPAPSADRAIHLQRPSFAQRPRGRLRDRAAFGLRLGSWKLIEGRAEGRRQLFDLAVDPHERNDRAPQAPERAEALQAAIAAWRREVEARHPAGAATPAPVADDVKDSLRALGYAD